MDGRDRPAASISGSIERRDFLGLLGASLIGTIIAWFWTEGTVSVQSVNAPRVECFYWTTILFSQTLGTALGDWVAGSDRGGLGLGYEVGALIFGSALALAAAAYLWTEVSRTALFWIAFVLTRPLGEPWEICSTNR